VEGPIAYLETTTNSRIHHENATRCFEIHLDESEEQTGRIHQRQRESRMEGTVYRQAAEAIRHRHHNAQRLLEPVRIFIPYVSLLSFPKRWLRTRRDHERFLSLVDASAFLHQHQREGGTTEEEGKSVRFIRASLEDYRLAYSLANEVLRSTLHELTRGAQELWGILREMVCEQSQGRDIYEVCFTRRDVRSYSGWPDRKVRDALQELVEMEYIGALSGSQGRTYQYRLLTFSETTPSVLGELTSPEELERLLAGGGAQAPSML